MTIKVVPTPYSLSTSIVPSISSIREWVIASPSPLPSTVLFLSTSNLLNLSKRESISSGFMPIPVSFTLRTRRIPFSCSIPLSESVILPSCVYFTALFKIFTITWRILISSPKSLSGIVSSMSNCSFRAFCCAFKFTILKTSLSTEDRSYSASCISILPDSILEKSRISFIRESSVLPALSIF